ncbi:MAG: hypothetical protein C0453_01590 [Comamonadaceae bacterium]|nr:hypothetical protein [Comamonadaceae bacterium]
MCQTPSGPCTIPPWHARALFPPWWSATRTFLISTCSWPRQPWPKHTWRALCNLRATLPLHRPLCPPLPPPRPSHERRPAVPKALGPAVRSTEGSPVSLNAFAHALLEPSAPVPAELVVRNGGNLVQRFAVHRNNTLVSLVDALQASYPVVAELVGEAFFRAMAGVYVRQSPPTSPVLSHYGQDFDRFIAAFEPALTLPYLPSVAQVEAACALSLHAADHVPMDPEQVARVIAGGDSLARRGCRLAPTLVPLSLTHAGAAIWMAHQPDTTFELSAIDTGQPQEVLLHRSSEGVVVWEPPAGTVALVRQLMNGLRLIQAVQAVAQTDDGFDFAMSWGGLLHHGLVVDLPLLPLLPHHTHERSSPCNP